MSEIVRTDDKVNGSVTIAAHLDLADLVKADRNLLDELEIAMREALAVVTGSPDSEIAKRRWRMTARNLFGALKSFAILLVLICLVVAMARVALFAVETVWEIL